MEKCSRIGVDPADVTDLFLTHVDPDHAGGLDARCVNLFKNARIYLGKLEENYLTNTWHRKKIGPLAIKNSVQISKGYRLLEDEETVMLGDLKITSLGWNVYSIRRSFTKYGSKLCWCDEVLSRYCRHTNR